jgi:periplasmic protein CpxP/Spy
MKWMPEKLHGRAGRAVGLAAAVATLAVAIPNVAIANGGNRAASAGAQSSPQVASNASTQPGAAKLSATSKNAHADAVETRIKDLHARLKITAAQEEQWNALTQVMRENARTLDSLRQSRVENAASMTALDDIRSYSEIADAHAQGLKNFVPAFEALYDSMSDSQKKLADQTFRGNTRMAGRAPAAAKGS